MCREGGGRVHAGFTVGSGSEGVGWLVYTGFTIG